jgi:hypothetical protein
MKLVDITGPDGKRYVLRDGKRIEVVSLDPPQPKKTRRKAFEVEFVKVPVSWVKALRGSNGAAYQLAWAILCEAFKREHMGGAIVLSSAVTGMRPTTRKRAIKELERLGLIRIEQQHGNQAPRVSIA